MPLFCCAAALPATTTIPPILVHFADAGIEGIGRVKLLVERAQVFLRFVQGS